MPPPFGNFSLDTLNSEQKLSAKNRSTGPVRNQSTGRSTGRSTGDNFEIYRSSRVEKILTGPPCLFPNDKFCIDPKNLVKKETAQNRSIDYRKSYRLNAF